VREFWRIIGLLFVFLVVLGYGGILISAASAQEVNTNQTTVGNQTGTAIDGETVLLDSSYNAQTGTAEVTIHSQSFQKITVSDAGGFLSGGGQIETETIKMRPGQTTTIKLPVTEYGGRVGVSISTSETLYGEIIQVKEYLFYQDPDWGTVQIGATASGLGVILAVVGDVLRRKVFASTRVTRLA
jgi:hypothetical protein